MGWYQNSLDTYYYRKHMAYRRHTCIVNYKANNITLLYVTSKIHSRNIYKRLADALYKYWAINRQVLDQEDVVSIIYWQCSTLEQSQACKSTLYVRFIDFQKAFGSFHMESLWNSLLHYGISNKLFNLIEMTYRNSFDHVLCDGTKASVNYIVYVN